MIKNYFKSKYYKRILFLIFVAGIIPVLTLSSFVLKLTSIYSSDFYEMHKSIIVNQKKRVEDTLESTEYTMIQFLSLPEVTKIMRTPRKAEHFQEFNAISSALFQMQSPRLEINDTILVSFEQDWVLSTYSFTDIKSSPYDRIIKVFFEYTRSSFWYSDETTGYIYMVKKIPMNARDANGLLILRINDAAIQNITADQNENFPVTIVNMDGTGIIGKTENLEIAKYAESLSGYDEEILSGGIMKLSYKGENYTITSSKSEYNGWIYLSIALTSQLNESIHSLYYVIITLILLLVVAMIIFSLNFSRKLYQPIDSLNQAMDNEIMASGEAAAELCNEENPHNKLKYILFSISELRNNLTQQKKNEIHNFLYKVYSGNHVVSNEDEFIEKGITDRKINGCHMHVIGFKYMGTFENRKDCDLFLFALQNIIEETFLKEEFFPPVSVNDIVYVTYAKKAPSEIGVQFYLKNLCESIGHIVEKYMQRKIYMGISSCFYNIKTFDNAIDECNMALRICVQRHTPIEFYTRQKDNNFLYPDTKINLRRMKIIQSVTNGDSKTGKTQLDEYFLELRQINYFLFKIEINNLLSDILTCMQSSFIPIDYTLTGEITNFDITNSVNSIDELKKYFWENFLVPLYKKAVEPPETETANTVQEIIEYLNENIENNISLEQCARHFNYNPNYLSRMFKNHFGTTFTEYIIDQKVKKSKQLLLTTDLSINEIALKLGYNNSQNFIRVFKKNVLLTPGQFRSKNQNK